LGAEKFEKRYDFCYGTHKKRTLIWEPLSLNRQIESAASLTIFHPEEPHRAKISLMSFLTFQGNKSPVCQKGSSVQKV
jgi:hypothetical protein